MGHGDRARLRVRTGAKRQKGRPGHEGQRHTPSLCDMLRQDYMLYPKMCGGWGWSDRGAGASWAWIGQGVEKESWDGLGRG